MRAAAGFDAYVCRVTLRSPDLPTALVFAIDVAAYVVMGNHCHAVPCVDAALSMQVG